MLRTVIKPSRSSAPVPAMRWLDHGRPALETDLSEQSTTDVRLASSLLEIFKAREHFLFPPGELQRPAEIRLLKRNAYPSITE